jgi:hypothetical protein
MPAFTGRTLFLLITPASRPFGSIEAACTIVGKTDRMRGVGTGFSSAQELETKLAIAGLPEGEIERAIQRLEMNYPTFSEINRETAESLRLVERFVDTSHLVEEAMPDTLACFRLGPN